MLRIESSVVINRSIEEVFAFVTDVEKFSQWSAVAEEVKRTSEGPMGVGTMSSFVAHFLGRRLEGTSVRSGDRRPVQAGRANPRPHDSETSRNRFRQPEGFTGSPGLGP